jgi:hypothetical protein
VLGTMRDAILPHPTMAEGLGPLLALLSVWAIAIRASDQTGSISI